MSALGHYRTWRPWIGMSALPPKDGVIGRPAFKCWRLVLRFRLMAIRGHRVNGPQASEGEAQHGAFCRTGRIGQGDQRLAISKRILEMHGGQIWIESQVGQGSTFFVTSPIQQAKA